MVHFKITKLQSLNYQSSYQKPISPWYTNSVHSTRLENGEYQYFCIGGDVQQYLVVPEAINQARVYNILSKT